jgi:hypothetical protein
MNFEGGTKQEAIRSASFVSGNSAEWLNERYRGLTPSLRYILQPSISHK